MKDPEKAIAREKETIEVMIGMYCKGNHSEELCMECSELRDYAFGRIDSCPIRDRKVKCSECEIHCYSPEMRERVRAVMRYSGPKMAIHPVLAFRHLLG